MKNFLQSHHHADKEKAHLIEKISGSHLSYEQRKKIIKYCNIFDTHPLTDNRIAKLDQRIAPLEKQKEQIC